MSNISEIVLTIMGAFVVYFSIYGLLHFLSERSKTRKETSSLITWSSKETRVKDERVKAFISYQAEIQKYRNQLSLLKTKLMKKAFKAEQNRIMDLMKKETDSSQLKEYSETLANLKVSKPETRFEKNKTFIVSMISSFLSAVVTLATTLLVIHYSG